MEEYPMHPNIDPADAESASPNVPVVYEEEDTCWQYKCIRQDWNEESPLDEKALNKLGKEGWELINVVSQSDHIAVYYFKRLES